MVDIGTLRHIIAAAQAIKEAAENVEQNQKDCEEMGGCVALLTTQLERRGNNGPLMMDPAVSPAVAALEEILREAWSSSRSVRSRGTSYIFCVRPAPCPGS